MISVQFSRVQFSSSVEFSSIQFSSAEFSSFQFGSVQFSSVRSSSVQLSSAEFSSIIVNVQFSSVQSSSAQIRSVQFSSAQNSSAQYSSAQFSLASALLTAIVFVLVGAEQFRLFSGCRTYAIRDHNMISVRLRINPYFLRNVGTMCTRFCSAFSDKAAYARPCTCHSREHQQMPMKRFFRSDLIQNVGSVRSMSMHEIHRMLTLFMSHLFSIDTKKTNPRI